MSNDLKIERRKAEQLKFQRVMFWHKPDSQELIKQLLQKIYDLEDEISIIKNNNK